MTEGIILLAKPAGVSSFNALSAVKRVLGTRRVGHAGTLDPFAEGLLLALSGSLTRLASFASVMDKEYLARITFGSTTDTLDPEGTVVGTGPVPERASLEAALPGFVGSLRQVPPPYSAIHVDGRRAYQAARKGQAVVLAPREVTVSSLELVSWDPPDGLFRISCSKGTYVRAIARDIGERLGTCAFVSALTRTRIGGFRLSEATPPLSFTQADLLPASVFFDRCPGLARLTVRERWADAVRKGVPVRMEFFDSPPPSSGTYGAFDARGDLLALVRESEGSLSYAAVFPRQVGS